MNCCAAQGGRSLAINGAFVVLVPAAFLQAARRGDFARFSSTSSYAVFSALSPRR